MPIRDVDFQVKLWDAIDRWARGNIDQKMKAVVEVNRLIESRPCEGCGQTPAQVQEEKEHSR